MAYTKEIKAVRGVHLKYLHRSLFSSATLSQRLLSFLSSLAFLEGLTVEDRAFWRVDRLQQGGDTYGTSSRGRDQFGGLPRAMSALETLCMKHKIHIRVGPAMFKHHLEAKRRYLG